MITLTKPGQLAINGGRPVAEERIPIHLPYMDESDFKAVEDTVRSTFVSGNGPKCMEFERKLAEFLGVKYVLFTNSCTTALDLAFKVKQFPAKAEVLVPNFTYTSSALGPLLNNLTVKLVDVNADNGNIDVAKIEQAITKNTVAIVPVDYAGNPADMDEVMRLARKHNLYVVHDTAQSIGSEYKGRKTGTLAHVSTFSFHGTKNLTTGEGGALVTDDDEIAERAMYMREKGTDKQSFLVDNKDRGFYEYVDLGSSFVQSNLLGALGIAQLEKIDWMNAERARIAAYYKAWLQDVPGLDFLKLTGGATTNWHLFGILVPPKHRYWIMDALRAEGVLANVHYTPLHRNKFYRGMATDEEMEGSMAFFRRLLRLPIYPSLTSLQRTRVVEAVKKVMSALPE
ncbi:MAG: DegT/DnrJ/EryC1/StrS family aminotransferase [Phaeodactylibacter sp.]|nr:DegT/DnrJ/EryC1/StrS family aminotransferase [Phaeodactylibacter sp.]MCB9292740.1 DegT/DnrJ/EryC1/StrS family aminotransferase [Lewinellaceae bacterium]